MKNNNSFLKFFYKLKKINNINDYNDLLNFFKKKEIRKNYFNIKKYLCCYIHNEIIIIYSKAKKYVDLDKVKEIIEYDIEILKKIINEFEICLLNKNNFELIFINKKNINFLDDVKKYEKFSIKILNDYDYNEIYLLKYKEQILIIDKTNVINITNKKIDNLKYKYIIKKINISLIEPNMIYKFLIRINSFILDKKVKFIKKYNINDRKSCNFKNYNFNNLEKLIINDEKYLKKNKVKIKKVGYILKIYDNDYDCLKLKFNYSILKKIKLYFTNNNIHINYLNLYQNNMIDNLLPYISDYYKELKIRLHNSVLTISREILDIYHLTRKKNNIFDNLTNSYKNILVDLHKMYNLKKNNELEDSDDIYLKNSINLNDVNKYIKNLKTNILVKLYNDRLLIKDNLSNKIIKDCINCKIQNELMKNVKF